MQPSCRVYQQNICFFAFCTLYSVKNNSGSVGTFIVLDYPCFASVCPCRKLFTCSSAECVTCHKSNFFLLMFEIVCKFANCCSFSNAINPNHCYNTWIFNSWLVKFVKDIFDNNFQSFANLVCCSEFVFTCIFTQSLCNFFRAFITNVARYQNIS